LGVLDLDIVGKPLMGRIWISWKWIFRPNCVRNIWSHCNNHPQENLAKFGYKTVYSFFLNGLPTILDIKFWKNEGKGNP
jgi:hypothetical protein